MLLEANNRNKLGSIVFSLSLCSLGSSRNTFFLTFVNEQLSRISEFTKVPQFIELKGKIIS